MRLLPGYRHPSIDILQGRTRLWGRPSYCHWSDYVRQIVFRKKEYGRM